MKKLFALIAAMIICMSLASCQLSDKVSEPEAKATESMEVHFIDVGQADCTLITSQGEAMLIDGGNRDDASLILNYLQNEGIEKLKYIVFTHPDEDHCGGGAAVLYNYQVDEIFMQEVRETKTAEYLYKIVEKLNVDHHMPEAGESASLGECQIEFLGPVEDYGDTNENSICLAVKHGDNRMLFTGDAEVDQEDDMIDAGENLEANLLKAGHHGSSTSTGYRLLREANPEYVIISCGENNQYGHPHRETLSKLSDLGAQVYRTDQQGTIVAVSDGKTFEFNVEGKDAQVQTEAVEDNAAAKEGSYIGNINSEIYHRADCGSLPAEHNRVYFKSSKAAKDAGYRPCGNCNP